jgi:transcriptional regulator GlxA family with amidase domain
MHGAPPRTTTLEPVAASVEGSAGADSVHTFGFLLVPDFSMIAFTSAIEPLRLANRCSGKALYGWRIFSPDGLPVAASNGVSIAVDGSYADVGPMPAVVVCAGVDVQRFDHRELIAKLRTLAFYGVSIGAVCTGTHVLARAGLLSGRRCTIHWENHDSFREEFSDIEVTQELFEIDRNRFTCAGGTAAIDMMLFADRTFALVTVASFVSGIAFSLMFLSSFLVLLGIRGYAQGLMGLAVALLCLPLPRQSGRIAPQSTG